MRNLLLCLAVLLPFTACASTPDDASLETGSPAAARNTPPVGNWTLLSFADSDAAPAAAVSFSVADDGKISGTGGCNRYFGMWSLDSAQKTLGPIGATRRMCDATVMDVETRYLAALSRVAGWVPTDEGIQLTDTTGNPLLTFRAE